MNDERGRFLGKYRGRVTASNDPLQVGRVRAKVPDVFGDEESGWALPCFAFAGPGVGLFMVPPVGAWVWIEFEYGDPASPIWTGCFFPDDPTAAAATKMQLLPLESGVGANELVLKTGEWLVRIDRSKLSVESLLGGRPCTRIELTAGTVKLANEQLTPLATIEMTGNAVRINGTALEVT